MASLARSIVLKTVYLILAWVLMVSYQIFTQTALTTVTFSLSGTIPTLAAFINSKADMTIFICSFAWMFVLSALISILMFGRERRLTIQFIVSLALTLTGSALLGLLHLVGLDLTNPNVISQPFTQLFNNVLFAFFYLALPFIFMAAIDLGLMKIRK
jgi:hypothetical protein